MLRKLINYFNRWVYVLPGILLAAVILFKQYEIEQLKKALDQQNAVQTEKIVEKAVISHNSLTCNN